ncbi:MAG: aminotransferase class I/II-fold pyridoxal phosphate-dependent enzyme [Chloroflexi bacterium]|nr:aminotransferase class I/II-fold pyridoxal phosphate-dependent enzyme [Chloroflexota bacterium]
MTTNPDRAQPAAPAISTATLYGLMAKARAYDDRIELGRGDPDFDTPPHIVAAFAEAIKRVWSEPNPPEGILPLRVAIAERLRRVNRIEADPETEIVVTNGGQHALFVMVQAALAPGDEILVPDPNYNTYRDAIAFAHGVRVSVPTHIEEDFRVDPARVAAAITPRTRGLLMVSPNNPAASVISRGDVQELTELARAHHLTILADDIYDRFLYDGLEHVSPASLPGVKDYTLTLNAVSKQYAMCGWRLGWIAGPAHLMERVRQIKASISGSTSLVAQHGALAALNGPDDCIVEMQQAYARRREVVMQGLDRLGLRYGRPQGGQFIFADISSTGMTSLEFAAWVLEEAHVLLYPGGAFGAAFDHFIRITFLQPEERLAEALERIARLMNKS